MRWRAESQKFYRLEQDFKDYPHIVQIDWDKTDRNSTDVHRWTVEMNLQNHRDYIVVNTVNSRSFRFKDPNMAMLFKLAWH